MKGLTFHEVDSLFAQGTKARDFKKTKIMDGVGIGGVKLSAKEEEKKRDH